ncbi:MAG: class I tRNA ligase family protein [Candidatus Saccharibacteria bacterium]
MKFTANNRRKAIEYEKDWVEKWKADKTFEKSVEQRPKDNAYVFYDGPPFLTGLPHHGSLLSSLVKDAVPRYWTMRGKRVERVWGWDTHGLPAENAVEKKLGITDRHDIGTKISLELSTNRSGARKHDPDQRRVGSQHRPHRPLGRVQGCLQNHGQGLHGERLVGVQGTLRQG